MKRNLFCISILLLLFALQSTQAQIPRKMSYQGILTDSLGNPKPDGSYSFKFTLHTALTGGTALWSETKDLTVKRGLFYTDLGSQTALPDSLRFNKPYWLSVTVGTDPELQPRIALTSTAYSFFSIFADTAKFAIVSTPSRPLSPPISNAEIQDGSIDSTKLSGNSITSSKVKDGSIQRTDVSPDFKAPNADIADTVRKAPQAVIGPGSIDSTKLASNSVTSTKILDGTIRRSDLADSIKVPNADSADYVRNAAIPPGTIDSTRLAANSVTSSKIKDGTITNDDVSATAFISQAKIDNSTLAINAAKLDGFSAASFGNNIIPYTSGDGKLNSDVISIPPNSVVSSHLVDGTIIDADINSSANISPGKIAWPINIQTNSVQFLLGLRNLSSGGGIWGISESPNAGIRGDNNSSGYGVYGYSLNGVAVFADAVNNDAIRGQSLANSVNYAGISGIGNGSARGVYARSLTSNAGYFEIANSANNSPTLFAITSGTNNAGFFKITNLASTNPVIYAESNGLSTAATFKVTNSSNNSPPLQVYSTNSASGVNLVEGFVGVNRKFSITNAGGYNGPGDFAEAIDVIGDPQSYEPGDVIVISTAEDATVEKCSYAYSSAIMGVYSTEPGFLGFSGLTRLIGKNEIPVAVVGIVPCKVSTENGAIQRGDLLTTSSSLGYAMKASEPRVGTILGKALESLQTGKRKIKVLVTLH